ncbi:hypothetical protein [Ferrovibrio terrae]|uniref:hypothetical protein n=1 Tax=Ferrovibrio terrae TaxID=2594003 RepID=UPI0031381470
MTDIQLDVPTHVTHHDRGRRLALGSRLQAAFGAFLAPEKFADTSRQPVSNDNEAVAWADQASSLTDPLALPPDWHGAGDLLSLSFLPFDR